MYILCMSYVYRIPPILIIYCVYYSVILENTHKNVLIFLNVLFFVFFLRKIYKLFAHVKKM